MVAATCPSCGADLTFRASVSVYAVCASCGSMVVRAGIAVEAIGQAATLPEDITPLQLGTSLRWHEHQFTIIGRARIAWQDGAWNEWFIDDGETQGWLADAQGSLSIAFEQPLTQALDGDLPRLGAQIGIGDHVFRVVDLKQAACVGSEGELPFRAPKGRAATYVDMISGTGGFAGLEETAGARRLYVGSYMNFAAFRFANLRDLDGWTEPALDTRIGDPRYIAKI